MSFFLVEEFPDPVAANPDPTDDPGDLVLPAGWNRRLEPNEPGYVLTWNEHPADGGDPYPRAGLVIAAGPRQGSVWVHPHRRRDGEGVAVLIDGVYTSGAKAAEGERPHRRVGTPQDRLSLARWQQIRDLPHPVLRVDRVDYGHGRVQEVTRLHATTDCRPAPDTLFGSTTTPGTPQPVTTCWVVDGELHPLSRLPVDRTRPPHPTVTLCPLCLTEGTKKS